MSKQKGARAGGKFTGSHTTVVPAAASIADAAHKCAAVTKIAIGYIKAGLPSAKGRKAVKIVKDKNGSLLISVRDNTTHQELRVFTIDPVLATEAIVSGARERGFEIRVQDGPH